MADRYGRSTDGADGDGGTTWALAKATLAGLAAIDAAGDRIFLSQAHAEVSAAAITAVFEGTGTTPSMILCGNDAAEPPTALATTASITTTGTSDIIITGAHYVYGLILTAGNGAGLAQILLYSGYGTTPEAYQKWEDCQFIIGSSHADGAIIVRSDGSTNGYSERIDGGVRLGAAYQRLLLSGGAVLIRGGYIVAGGTTPTAFIMPNTARRVKIDGFDLSNFSAGVHMIYASSAGAHVVFRNCKLPASWSGSLYQSVPDNPGSRGEMYNCSSGDVNYAIWIEDNFGQLRDNTVIVRTGASMGAGIPVLSWQITTAAKAEYPLNVFRSGEMATPWLEAGVAVTVTAEIVHDTNVAGGQGAGTAFAFQDDEVWLEVQYLGTSGFPLSVFANDCKASVLAAAADQASSSEAWTTTGMTTPVAQKMSVTFTPQESGPALCVVCAAKASKTFYVWPDLTVT